MSEKENKESTPDNTGEGDKYETTPIIERAREEREKLDAVVKELRIENDRREAIMARKELGGITEAGQTKEEPKETPQEYAKRIHPGA